MSRCPRCRRDDGTDVVGLCLSCENDLDLSEDDDCLDDSDNLGYDEKLADGFALIDADEYLYGYNDRWS